MNTLFNNKKLILTILVILTISLSQINSDEVQPEPKTTSASASTESNTSTSTSRPSEPVEPKESDNNNTTVENKNNNEEPVYTTTTAQPLVKPEKYECKDSDRGLMCTEEWVGLCAYKKASTCNDDGCVLDMGTRCQACAKSDTEYVLNVSCANERAYYNQESNNTDNSNTLPPSNEKNEIYTTAVVNDGLPTGINNNFATINAINCTDADRNATCDNNLKQTTCGFYYSTHSSCDINKSSLCDNTYNSKCLACKDKDIEKYVVGECMDPKVFEAQITANANADTNNFSSRLNLGFGLVCALLISFFM